MFGLFSKSSPIHLFLFNCYCCSSLVYVCNEIRISGICIPVEHINPYHIVLMFSVSKQTLFSFLLSFFSHFLSVLFDFDADVNILEFKCHSVTEMPIRLGKNPRFQ